MLYRFISKWMDHHPREAQMTWPAQSVTLTKESQTLTELAIGEFWTTEHPTINTAIRQAPKLNHSSSQPKIEVFWSKQSVTASADNSNQIVMTKLPLMMKLNCNIHSTLRDGSSLAVTGHLNGSPKFLGRANNHLPGQITRHPIDQQPQPLTRTLTRDQAAIPPDSLRKRFKETEKLLGNIPKTTKHPKHL